jgi:hypothetical protein
MPDVENWYISKLFEASEAVKNGTDGQNGLDVRSP